MKFTEPCKNAKKSNISVSRSNSTLPSSNLLLLRFKTSKSDTFPARTHINFNYYLYST